MSNQEFREIHKAPMHQMLFQINRRLLAWSDNDVYVDWLYVVICLLLTCMAGLMSGLTLGLLSLDTVDLEVLVRSGTASEQKHARKIMPLISNSHLLLVTLLLCNALAMEALPLFLDKLADPVTAVVVSVTAVLFFGEIIPQSVCSRYGLRIGASLAPLVRLLMWLCSPVAWPMGKLLDLVMGPDHHTLFRRRQLKELVSMHAEDAGMGGALTRDEIKVITGALDLTSKVAYRAMTPLGKVFMLSSSDRLDERTLRAILHSGHSRVPVHREGDRGDVVGLVLVKELLQYRLGSSASEEVPVGMLRVRSIPRLPATTRMYDMLRLFQTGRSHIAVLTQPPRGELRRLLALDPSRGSRVADSSRSRSGKGGARAWGHGAGGGGAAAAARQGSAAPAGVDGVDLAAAVSRAAEAAALSAGVDDTRSFAAETEPDADGFLPYGLYDAPSGGMDVSYPASTLDPQEAAEAAEAAAAVDFPASLRHWGLLAAPRGEYEESSASGGGPLPHPPAEGPAVGEVAGQSPAPSVAVASTSPPRRMPSVFAGGPAATIAAAAAAASASPDDTGTAAPAAAAEVGSTAPPPLLPRGPPSPSPSSSRPPAQNRLSRMGLEAGAAGALEAAAGAEGGPGDNAQGAAALPLADGPVASGAARGGATAVDAVDDSAGHGACPRRAAAAACDADTEYDGDEPEEGRPIGIITIEDVIEELIRAEIVDETDRYVDNNRLIRANPAQLAQSLPEHLAKVLAAAGASKKAAARQRGMPGGSVNGGAGPAAARRSFASGLGGLGSASSLRDWSHGSGGHAHYQPQPHQSSHSPLRVPLLQAEQSR